MASKGIQQKDMPSKSQGMVLKQLDAGKIACGTLNKPTESAVVRKGWATLSGGWLSITQRGRDALLLVD